MTKDQLRALYPDIEFSKSAMGRETASIPLSKSDKSIARLCSSTLVEDGHGGMVESEEANEASLDSVRRVIAAREVLGADDDGKLRLGDWKLNSSTTVFLEV